MFSNFMVCACCDDLVSQTFFKFHIITLRGGVLLSNRCNVYLRKKKRSLCDEDAAAVMNAAVFKMLICRNEMHSSEPVGLL